MKRGELYRVSSRRRLDEATLRDIPDEPGVYWLYRGSALLFVGIARRSLRARVWAHLKGVFGPCSRHADEYQWQTTSQPTSRARAVLLVYQARTGHLPRCNDALP
jgi:hypothetical protein